MNTALQVWDGDLSMITTPPPRVATPSDVVIKVSFSGVCGTDLHILAKEFPCAKTVVLGHEFSGVVSEVGSEVKHCAVGERYMLYFYRIKFIDMKSALFKVEIKLLYLIYI